MKHRSILFWQTALIGVLSITCLVLGWENKLLKASAPCGNGPQFKMPAYGDSIQPFSYLTIDGEEREIELYDSEYSHLLVGVFTPECPACTVAVRLWTDLAPRLPESVGLRILCEGSAGELIGFMMDAGLDLDAGVPFDGTNFGHVMGFNTVPMTILARRGGIVEEAWRGPYSEEMTGDLLLSIQRYAAIS